MRRMPVEEVSPSQWRDGTGCFWDGSSLCELDEFARTVFAVRDVEVHGEDAVEVPGLDTVAPTRSLGAFFKGSPRHHRVLANAATLGAEGARASGTWKNAVERKNPK